MSKHNQSAALGTLSDFASSPVTPEDRLERIESRLENIEKLLNTVLYAVTDLNATVDKVSKSPATPKSKGRGEGKKNNKIPNHSLSEPKRQPAPTPKKAKGKASDFTSHFTDEQMAEINASKSDVQKLFTDRETITKAEAVKLLPDLDTKLIGRVLFVLVSEGFFSMREPEATAEDPDPKVIFTRK